MEQLDKLRQARILIGECIDYQKHEAQKLLIASAGYLDTYMRKLERELKLNQKKDGKKKKDTSC